MTEPARILVVCTANVCRSPVGQALLARVAVDLGASETVRVASAGTRAHQGRPADDESSRTAARWGVDLDGHRSRPLTVDMVADSDLVLTMEQGQREAVLRLRPRALSRTFTWLELARLATHLGSPSPGDGSDPVARVRATARAAHRVRPLVAAGDDLDVADPIGQPRRHHRRMATTLVESARSFLPLLLVGRPT